MFNRKNSIQDMDAYVEERLSDYLDGTLSTQERATVEAYLAQSERARASLDALRYTVNLLKQTPAPALPRQFTLPVTSRAPAQGAPGWLVWSLRGVGAVATVAFVALFVGLLFKQNPANTAATAPSARTVPSAVIAMAATSAPSLETVPQNSANDTNPTPIMITVEAPSAAVPPIPVTETPAVAANKSTAQQDSSLPAPTMSPATQVPTVKPENTRAPEATVAAASASGVNNGGGAPEFSAATETPSLLYTQRSVVALRGEILLIELKVREGPGTEYRTIGGLRFGESVLVLGKSSDEMWLLIDYPKNKKTHQGWVSSPYVRLDGSLDLVPFAEFGQPEPEIVTPTETETPTPTVAHDDSNEPQPTAVPTDANSVPPMTPVPIETKPAEGSPSPRAPQENPTETPTPEPRSGVDQMATPTVSPQ